MFALLKVVLLLLFAGAAAADAVDAVSSPVIKSDNTISAFTADSAQRFIHIHTNGNGVVNTSLDDILWHVDMPPIAYQPGTEQTWFTDSAENAQQNPSAVHLSILSDQHQPSTTAENSKQPDQSSHASTEISLAMVPLPAAVWSMMTGLLGLLYMGRRKK